MFKLRGAVTHVRSNWQSSFEGVPHIVLTLTTPCSCYNSVCVVDKRIRHLDKQYPVCVVDKRIFHLDK